MWWNTVLAAAVLLTIMFAVLPKEEYNSGRVVYYVPFLIGVAFLFSWMFTPFIGVIGS